MTDRTNGHGIGPPPWHGPPSPEVQAYQKKHAEGAAETPPEPPKKPNGKQALATVGMEDLKEMSKEAMQKLCRAAGVPATGSKAELRKRLEALKLGGDEKHVHGRTLCRFCQTGFLLVEHTERGQWRKVRCTNRECGYKGTIPWKD